MSLLAEFEASSSSFMLGSTLSALPSLEVRLERQFALDPGRPIAVCWIRCGDPNRLEEAFDDDPTVGSFERIDDAPKGLLYRIRRSESGVVDAYRQWVDVGGELLGGRASNGSWTIEMRFPDRDAFNRYHEFLRGEGVTFELHRLADGPQGDRLTTDRDPLTDSQRDALRLAYEYGFFEIPREAELSAVADALAISEQAVSERLRRGQSRLIETHVVKHESDS